MNCHRTRKQISCFRVLWNCEAKFICAILPTGLLIVLSRIISKETEDVTSAQQQLQTDSDINVAIQTATDDVFGITSPKQLERYLVEKKVMVLEETKREWEQVIRDKAY